MFDIAVVGAGVVGCAVARRLALMGARVVLLEQGPDILSGASKGNSAILHTGFDAPAASLELACMQAGRAEYLEIREHFGLPLLETGAIVAAWSDDEQAKLPAIAAQANANGVTDVALLDRAALLARVPTLSPHVKAGLLVPGEHLIDPWSAPLAYVLQAQALGATVHRRTQVTAARFDGAAWQLETTTGPFRATTLINAAGLFGDHLETLALGETSFTIHPRKGQFVVFDKAAAKLLSTILLPVPLERTKGIVLTPTIFGNLLVGPTADEQDSRTNAGTDQASLQALIARAHALIPALAHMPVTALYAGIRPATERKEYRLRHEPARHYIGLNGIRSTGLTAALGLAQHAASLYQTPHTPIAAPPWPQAPKLAEHLPRDHHQPGYGEIICHCELVTQREIEAALTGPLPATDLGGLKRRTRATMGRCQGFYCLAHLAALTAGRLDPPLETPHAP